MNREILLQNQLEELQSILPTVVSFAQRAEEESSSLLEKPFLVSPLHVSYEDFKGDVLLPILKKSSDSKITFKIVFSFTPLKIGSTIELNWRSVVAYNGENWAKRLKKSDLDKVKDLFFLPLDETDSTYNFTSKKAGFVGKIQSEVISSDVSVPTLINGGGFRLTDVKNGGSAYWVEPKLFIPSHSPFAEYMIETVRGNILYRGEKEVEGFKKNVVYRAVVCTSEGSSTAKVILPNGLEVKVPFEELKFLSDGTFPV